MPLKRRERDPWRTLLRDEEKLRYSVEISGEVRAFVKNRSGDGMRMPERGGHFNFENPVQCHCSLGHSSYCLAGIGRAFRGEVLESVVRGDLRGRLVFHPVEKQA